MLHIQSYKHTATHPYCKPDNIDKAIELSFEQITPGDK
ncbi:hypothetical protein RG47T_0555 [Mucilaginibacter polytrichastri]|uniref:Uncharacterized protein n=1 Tax=Mucilaginibacter polytrichastri TaxID=1302689 RepID=A0A1Q5ZTM6_9SPHI|nr:hypothetical protein RG47T_0555 [Mucilaginibacter polytrichastri]